MNDERTASAIARTVIDIISPLALRISDLEAELQDQRRQTDDARAELVPLRAQLAVFETAGDAFASYLERGLNGA